MSRMLTDGLLECCNVKLDISLAESKSFVVQEPTRGVREESPFKRSVMISI